METPTVPPFVAEHESTELHSIPKAGNLYMAPIIIEIIHIFFNDAQ